MFGCVPLIVPIRLRAVGGAPCNLVEAKQDSLRKHSEWLANPLIPPRSKQPLGPGPHRGVRSRF